MLIPSFLLDWACRVEGDADSAPFRTDADVVVEKVVARLGVLYWIFAAVGHSIILLFLPIKVKRLPFSPCFLLTGTI